MLGFHSKLKWVINGFRSNFTRSKKHLIQATTQQYYAYFDYLLSEYCGKDIIIFGDGTLKHHEKLYVKTSQPESSDKLIEYLFLYLSNKSGINILEYIDIFEEFLLEKNRKYGDAALNPIRIFSDASNVEQIKVRIDDKLNRILNRQNDEDEDVLKDLLGYLILLKISNFKM